RHQDVLGLAAVDGVAEPPAAGRLETVLGRAAILRMLAAQAGIAVPAGRDRPCNDPLSLLVSRHRRAELLDHAHWFVADDQALAPRTLAAKDAHGGAADRGRGEAPPGMERPDIGPRSGVEDDPPRLHEHRRLHLRHRAVSL